MRTKTEVMTCQECGRIDAANAYHPFLYCELFKAGWTREQLVGNVGATVEFFGGEFNPKATIHGGTYR